jgi:hypothetical protein
MKLLSISLTFHPCTCDLCSQNYFQPYSICELFHSNGTHGKVNKIPCALIMSSISFMLSNFIHVFHFTQWGIAFVWSIFFKKTKFHPSWSFNSHGQAHMLHFIPKHNYTHGKLYLFVLKIPSNYFVSFGHIPSIYG